MNGWNPPYPDWAAQLPTLHRAVPDAARRTGAAVIIPGNVYVTADAIVIGTGIIGTAIAYELSKAGWKTLSLDRNSQIGQGSTAGSCAIIRMHYSTFDGTAFAWEGYHYWRDWAAYLDLPEDGC